MGPELNSERERKCIFCSIIEGGKPRNFITETDKSIAIVSLEGTPLVLPKRHVNELNISECIEDMIDVYRLANRLVPVVKELYQVTSVNLLENRGADAGQEIDHFHMHILPRRKKDKLMILRVSRMTDEEREKIALSFRDLLLSCNG